MLNGLNEQRQLLTVLLVMTGLSCFSAAALAAPVYLDPVTNLEWRQVKDTVGYSYESKRQIIPTGSKRESTTGGRSREAAGRGLQGCCSPYSAVFQIGT